MMKSICILVVGNDLLVYRDTFGFEFLVLLILSWSHILYQQMGFFEKWSIVGIVCTVHCCSATAFCRSSHLKCYSQVLCGGLAKTFKNILLISFVLSIFSVTPDFQCDFQCHILVVIIESDNIFNTHIWIQASIHGHLLTNAIERWYLNHRMSLKSPIYPPESHQNHDLTYLAVTEKKKPV